MKRPKPVGFKKIEQRWQQYSIRRKIICYLATVFFCVAVSILFNIWVAHVALADFNGILSESSKSSEFIQAVENEADLFEQYAKRRSKVNKDLLKEAMLETKEAVENLPDNYHVIGEERFALTWSIQNCYEVYVEARDNFLGLPYESDEYVESLYTVYDIQEHLGNYAEELMDYTLAEGSRTYKMKMSLVVAIPIAMIVASAFMILLMINLSGIMKRTIVTPLLMLAGFAKRKNQSQRAD